MWARIAKPLVLFAIPALIYAVIVTNGTMDPFYPEYGWVFYNQYAIALSEGRLWVPAEAIGPEGFYVEGRVYGYYGLLPALLRLPLLPFIDLRETPVAMLMTWLMCVASLFALQVSALDARRWAKARSDSPVTDWIFGVASLTLWFFSAPMLVIQNSSFYHEPFAASLLMSSIFILLSVRILLFQDAVPAPRQLTGLAVVAGLSLFTRQTTAVSLYVGVLVWLAASGWAELRPSGARPRQLARWVVAAAAPPLVILALAGGVYLWLNAVRFGHAGVSSPIDSYGYMLVRVNDPRLINIRDEGQFHWVRMAPNLVFALIGGDELRLKLIAALGGGPTAALGPVVRLALAWTPAFILSALTLAWLVRRCRHDKVAMTGLLIAGAFSVGALLQLAYATVQYRYHADLWPPLAYLMVCSVAAMSSPLSVSPRRALAIVSCTACAISAAYCVDLVRDRPSDLATTMNQPLPPILIQQAYLPGSRAPGLRGGTPLPVRAQK